MTTTRGSSLRAFAILSAAALAISACGGDSETADSTSTSSTATTMLTTTTSQTETTTTAPSTTTTSAPSTSLPGEPIEFGPMEGDQVMVIGVSFDDVLNLRRLPGTSYEIVDMIPPDYRDLRALGHTRDIGDAFWIEVEYEDTTGWVHMGFIGFEGVTDDMTAFVVEELGGRPSAETMPDLGLIVAQTFASEEPESDLMMVTPATVGDLGEVTYDVIGLGDDAVRGLRVHVFGVPDDGGFTLNTVEVTDLCGRGTSEDGLCT